MDKNPISEKYEPLQYSLVKKVGKLNNKVFNAIKRANVSNVDELVKFLGVYLGLQFKGIRKNTIEYLGVIKEEVNNVSENNNTKPSKYIIANMQNQTYIELNTNLVCAEKELMRDLKKVVEPFKNKPTHIIDIKNTLQNEFVKRGGVNITYKNGAKVQLDKYFEMATRTARNETQNATAIDNAKKLGTDYVYMAPNHSSCKTCATMGNRVYCISGKDPSYPSVYGTLFKHGYNCIHPHCKCMLRPYFFDNFTTNEIKEMQKNSNRSFDLDPRTEQQRQQYQESQAFNHSQWSSKKLFNEMKEELGDDSPYKTLAGLRRGKTLDSFNYKALKYRKRDKRQFEYWLSIPNVKNMPKSLAEFQKIKYNKDKSKYNKIKDNVYVEQFKLEIRNNKARLKLKKGSQEKHIKGTNNFEEGKSYFLDHIKLGDIQDIVNKYATYGEIIKTQKGKISDKELIICDKNIGYCKDLDGKWILTNRAIIHYSKKGTHLIPTLRGIKDNV